MKLLPLMPQVALDLELHVEGRGRSGGLVAHHRKLRGLVCGEGARLGPRLHLLAAELPVHGRVGEVGDVGHHARDREPDARAAALGIIALVPLGILEDGLTPDLVEGDGLGAFAGGRCHRQHALGEGGVLDAPLEYLHAAHGTADHGVEACDADRIEPALLGADHVTDRDVREGQAVGPARIEIDRGRATGTLATAQHVRAEDEELVRVECLAGTDQIVPPARLAVVERVDAGAVMVAAQRVADQDGVVAGGIEPAVGLVAQREAGEGHAIVADEGIVGNEVTSLDQPDLARLGPGGGGEVVIRVVHGRQLVSRQHTEGGAEGKTALGRKSE